MTKRMADGAYIETKDTSWADVLTAYGPNFGSTQGPWNIQPFNWLAAQTKPTWVIFFPGADPAKCLAYCRQFPHVVGAGMDVEARWESDAWTLAVVKSWGDQMTAIPRMIYSHRWYINSPANKIMAHYDARWYAGEPNQGDPGLACAVQWNYQTALGYDESVANDYYANPSGVYIPSTGGAPSPTGTLDMSAETDLLYRALVGQDIFAQSGEWPNAATLTWWIDYKNSLGAGSYEWAIQNMYLATKEVGPGYRQIALRLHELATTPLPVGPAGPTGAMGSTGPEGPPGATGAAGLPGSTTNPGHDPLVQVLRDALAKLPA